jgi:hypothetical protein
MYLHVYVNYIKKEKRKEEMYVFQFGMDGIWRYLPINISMKQ